MLYPQHTVMWKDMNNNRLFRMNQNDQSFLIHFLNHLIYLLVISNLKEPCMLVEKNADKVIDLVQTRQ